MEEAGARVIIQQLGGQNNARVIIQQFGGQNNSPMDAKSCVEL